PFGGTSDASTKLAGGNLWRLFLLLSRRRFLGYDCGLGFFRLGPLVLELEAGSKNRVLPDNEKKASKCQKRSSYRPAPTSNLTLFRPNRAVSLARSARRTYQFIHPLE